MVKKFAFKSSKKLETQNTVTEGINTLENEPNTLLDYDNDDVDAGGGGGGGMDFMDFLNSNDEQKDPISVGLDLLLSPTNIMMKTDVPAQAIPVLARAIALAKKYKSESLLGYLDNYLKLRVSKDRKGREEILAMILRTGNRNEFDDDF